MSGKKESVNGNIDLQAVKSLSEKTKDKAFSKSLKKKLEVLKENKTIDK